MHRPIRALVLLGSIAACDRSPTSVEPPSVGCPEDAMVCPDGSTVARSGPDCSFAPCPEDPCAGVELPPCPPACSDDAASRCGQPCSTEGETCGNEIGDGMTCQDGVWSCVVHAPLGQGCNLVCRPS